MRKAGVMYPDNVVNHPIFVVVIDGLCRRRRRPGEAGTGKECLPRHGQRDNWPRMPRNTAIKAID